MLSKLIVALAALGLTTFTTASWSDLTINCSELDYETFSSTPTVGNSFAGPSGIYAFTAEGEQSCVYTKYPDSYAEFIQEAGISKRDAVSSAKFGRLFEKRASNCGDLCSGWSPCASCSCKTVSTYCQNGICTDYKRCQ